MNIEELAANHSQDFPGFRLVDYYEAAFPSYKIQLQVLMQVKRALPVLEEFILKSVDAGQQTISEIAALLGLGEWNVVRTGIENLQERGYITLVIPNGAKNGQGVHISITPNGYTAMGELRLTEPEQGNFPFCLDAITGRLYPDRRLRQPGEMKDLDIHQIPTFISTPKLEDLNRDRSIIRQLVREEQRGLPRDVERRELVDILDFEKKPWIGYRIFRVLQFVRDDGEIQVEVFDGVERSHTHEEVLLQMESEAHRYRPLRAFKQNEVPLSKPEEAQLVSPQEVAAAKRKALEAPKLNQAINEKRTQLEAEKVKLGSNIVAERQEANDKIRDLERQLAYAEARMQELEQQAGTTEVLQMHEHRPKLLEALRTAKKQIIIVSPWMNGQSVDYELRQEIGKALKRGINIHIGHGFGDADRSEQRTLERLQELSKKKRGRLKTYRLGDVHSKVLICDDEFIVTTSFNWLSFKGDPTRGSRVEDGMLTRDKQAIAQKTREWMNRFKDVEEKSSTKV